jgi:hypothetical protein
MNIIMMSSNIFRGLETPPAEATLFGVGVGFLVAAGEGGVKILRVEQRRQKEDGGQ